MIGIYKITSPTGKIYIGQSINIKKRFLKYKTIDCKNQSRLYKSFIKYGVLNHSLEVIEQCEISELNNMERYWQDFYDASGKNGLNCILTRSTEKAQIISEQTKIKLSKVSIGVKKSETHSKNISKSKIGSKNGMYGKTPFNKGVKMSDELKIKISKKLKGRISHRKGIKTNKNSYNSMIILDINTGVFYYSVKEISDLFKIDLGSLHANLKRKNKVNKYLNLVIT